MFGVAFRLHDYAGVVGHDVALPTAASGAILVLARTVSSATATQSVINGGYLAKTFQIMMPANVASTRLTTSTYRTDPSLMPPDALVSEMSVGLSIVISNASCCRSLRRTNVV